MITDIINLISSANFSPNVTFMISPYEEDGFDWVPFASAALGGLLSLTASVLAFHLSNKSEEKRRMEQDKKTEAMHAMTGYFKILSNINILANIRLHIDKSFADAQKDETSPLEPYQCVGPSAGKLLEPERLKAEEYVFLLKLGDVDAINRVGLVEERSVNTQQLLEKYTEELIALEAWIDSIPALSRSIEGMRRVDEIPVEYKVAYETRQAKLNQIIGGIIEHLDDDIKEAQEVINKFVESANSVYSPYFPMITMGVNYSKYQ